jgi:signal peptidase I
MNNGALIAGRNKWMAAAMGLAMPGLGQIYNGELLKGVSFFGIIITLFVTGLRVSVLLPDKLLTIGVVLIVFATMTVHLLFVVDAYRKAGREEAYSLRPFNRWYFYTAIWLLGSIIITGYANNYTKTNVIEAYKIASASMEPSVLKGDRILVDKTAYKRMPPKQGNIVVFVYPDDRSKIFIKRIEGLPGNTIKLVDGREQTVPHGSVYVLGDNKGQSIDSRAFGFIPLRDVIGKARQIYYSSGSEGVRWNRIGLTLN